MMKKALVFMLVAELVSFSSFFVQELNLPLLVLIFASIFLVSYRRLDVGVYFLLGELFFGSRGRLLEYGFVSLRLVVFVAVVLAWIVREIPNLGSRFANRSEILRNKFTLLYLVFLAVLGLAALNGLRVGNTLSNVFFDLNGYLYFLALPLLAVAVRDKEQLSNIISILAAAVVVIGLKTLIVFVWFAGGYPGVGSLYNWLLSHDIGEVTGVVGGASRIFLQSQIYSLFGLFIFSLAVKPRWGLVALSFLAIILSFSRSFWLGGIAALLFSLATMKFFLGKRIGEITKYTIAFVSIGAAIVIGINLFVAVSGSGFADIIKDRSGNPASEASGSARLILLQEMTAAIKNSPIIGSGFGKVLTFESGLPDRITEDNPKGVIETYAFEWGYLDIWLKLGLVGLLVYLIFLAKLFLSGFQIVRERIEGFEMVFGLTAAYLSLLVLNVTTPYLNHPLGIGLILILYLAVKIYRTPEHEAIS